MLFRKQLFLILFLQLAAFAAAQQEEISKVVEKLALLETEINSNHEAILEIKNSYDQFFRESITLFRDLNATLARVDARTEENSNKIQHVDEKSQDNSNKIEGYFKMIIRPKLENILMNPQARLFTGAGKTGNNDNYNFKTPTFKGGCYNVNNYGGSVKSVDSMGKCVRLFSNRGCFGWSQAFYPGSSTNLDSKLNGVGSVGPCVDNEFEFVTVKDPDSSVFEVQKVKTSNNLYKGVPDLVEESSTRSGFLAVQNSPITQYLLGPGNRIEALYGHIYKRHITTAAQAEINRMAGLRQSFYSNLALKNNTDEVGFAFPLELAGPADQVYNVFPQDKLQAEKYRQAFVPLFTQVLTRNVDERVYLRLTFFYENATSLRPSGIWYRIEIHNKGNFDVRYGYFGN